LHVGADRGAPDGLAASLDDLVTDGWFTSRAEAVRTAIEEEPWSIEDEPWSIQDGPR
jgi:metal-responsive CopG/Arc/MetJ family transcriptional regulator